jgi:hypothetical protein
MVHSLPQFTATREDRFALVIRQRWLRSSKSWGRRPLSAHPGPTLFSFSFFFFLAQKPPTSHDCRARPRAVTLQVNSAIADHRTVAPLEHPPRLRHEWWYNLPACHQLRRASSTSTDDSRYRLFFFFFETKIVTGFDHLPSRLLGFLSGFLFFYF